MCRLLIAVVSLVAEYLLMGMQASVVFMCRLSNCGTGAVLPEARGIFPDGDIGRIDCTGMWIVNLWTTTPSLPPAPGIPTARFFSSYFTIFFSSVFRFITHFWSLFSCLFLHQYYFNSIVR